MKLFSIKDWSVLSKLMISVVISLIPMAVIFFFIMPMMEEKHLEGKHKEIRTAVEAPYNLIKLYHDKAKAGLITEEEAKKQASDAIAQLRYSGEEYYFIYNYEGNTIALGSNTKLVGTNRWDLQDKHGNFIVRDIIEAGRNGNGFYEYNYPKPGQTEELPKLSYMKNYVPWKWVLGSGFYIDDVEKEIAAFKAKMYPILIILLVLSSVLVYFLFKTIVVPVRKLKQAADKIASGEKNIKVEVTSKDEIGDLGLTFNLMSENIVKHLNDANEKSEIAKEMAVKAEQAKMEAQDQKVYLERNTKLILHEMDKFSAGDLTVSLEPENKNDDIGKLFLGFTRAVENIRKMMNDVMHAAEAAASATIQISSSSEELASGAQEQSSQANDVAAAVEQMTATILQTTKNIGIASQVSLEAGQAAKDGGNVVLQTVDGMNRISEVVKQAAATIQKLGNNSDQIGEIVQVIDDIADQTNLLALNAAIEAARAG